MTLAEILVAVAVIAIFTAGLAALATGLVRGSAKAKSMDIAVFLAHDRLEQVRNTLFADIIPATFPDEAYGTIVVGNPPVEYPIHQRSVTIQDNTPAAGIKRVVVTVSWRGGGVPVTEEMLVAP
jgi:type II secretory pathway pseudopilin PulG